MESWVVLHVLGCDVRGQAISRSCSPLISRLPQTRCASARDAHFIFSPLFTFAISTILCQLNVSCSLPLFLFFLTHKYCLLFPLFVICHTLPISLSLSLSLYFISLSLPLTFMLSHQLYFWILSAFYLLTFSLLLHCLRGESHYQEHAKVIFHPK